MSRLLFVFVAVLAAVLGSSVAAGVWSGRWGASQALREAAARLERVPPSLAGAWDVHPGELSEREVAIAELEGYLCRRYVHRRTGAAVSVLLVCGRPGPVGAHTPEVCYAGAGYALSGAARAYDGPAGSGWKFRVQDYQKTNVATPTRLRIFLAWGSRGEWSAPAKARWAFAGRPSLYKLYVVREMARANEPLDQDPAGELIKDLMPQLDEVLFGAA